MRRLTYEGADSIRYSDFEHVMHGMGSCWNESFLGKNLSLYSHQIQFHSWQQAEKNTFIDYFNPIPNGTPAPDLRTQNETILLQGAEYILHLHLLLWSIWAIIFFAECKRDSSFSPRWAFESSPPLRHCPNNSIPFLSSFWVFSSGTLLCGCNAESLQTMWRFLRRWEAPFYSADIHSSPSIDFFQGRLCVHSAKHSRFYVLISLLTSS